MNDNACSRGPRTAGANSENPSLFKGLRGWFRALRRNRNGEASVRETLEELIEEREDAEAPIDAHERLLLANILHLRNVTAYDVMVPRADVVALEAKTPLSQVVKVIGEGGHSRFPVYRGSLDEVIGMVHIKDILMALATERTPSLPRLTRPILFVSPSMRVLDLLLEMRLKRTHMALVVDEYGGIDGLVTVEDLVEQIVGEIEDEHDVDNEPEMIVLPDGSLETDARLTLDDFEEAAGIALSEEERDDIDTVGGLVFLLANRVPGRGELIAHPSGIEFEVVDADPRRIKRLRVRNLPPASTSSKPASASSKPASASSKKDGGPEESAPAATTVSDENPPERP